LFPTAETQEEQLFDENGNPPPPAVKPVGTAVHLFESENSSIGKGIADVIEANDCGDIESEWSL
jgi:hypothetical protein